MTDYKEWKCKSCGHENWSTERPQPIEWNDGHVCHFVRDHEIIYKLKCSGDQWQEFIFAMHSGARFEIDKEMFDYWRSVLPPIFLHEIVKLPQGEVLASFGFAEGAEPITVFWRDRGRYYGQRTDKINEG
jgi:hypothetical protein